MDERRKFERVRVPENANIHLIDEDGQCLGRVRTLGSCGLLLETTTVFAEGSPRHVTLVDEQQHIRREITVVARQQTGQGALFEFRSLNIEAAIDIGVIIGRYGPVARAQAA